MIPPQLGCGVRVVTRRPLKADTGDVYEAGAQGVVREAKAGVVSVYLDNDACHRVLVKGLPADFTRQPMLAVGTTVKCMPARVVVERETGERYVVFVERGTYGVVRSYDARVNCYGVDVAAISVRVEVPAHMAQPLCGPAMVAAVLQDSSDSDGGDPVLNLRKRPARSNLSGLRREPSGARVKFAAPR